MGKNMLSMTATKVAISFIIFLTLLILYKQCQEINLIYIIFIFCLFILDWTLYISSLKTAKKLFNQLSLTNKEAIYNLTKASELIDSQKRTIQEQNDKLNSLKYCSLEDAIQNEEIVSDIQKYAAKGIMPSIPEWKKLFSSIHKHYPLFISQLSTENPNISSQELKLCILTKLEISPSQIANLLGVSKQSVTNMRKKLNKQLFNKEDAKSFSHNIKNILK